MPTVIFVPGFGGNVLKHFWPTPNGYREAWMQPDVLIGSGLEILALNSAADGPRFPVLPNLISGGAIGFYYPAILRFLAQAGWKLDVARSDWRKPLAFSAPGLAAQIRVIGGIEGPVRVVAHSRGGLLIGAALQLLAASGDLGKVRQVVTLCTPHGGSYGVVPWLGGWPWKSPSGIAVFTAAGLTLVEAVLRRQVCSVFRTFPGAYELLPDPARAAAAGDVTAQGLFDNDSWARSNVPIASGHLAAAHLRWLNAPPWPASVRTSCIVGTGTPTVCTSVVLGALDVPGCLQGATDGDGVVPSWSAVVPGQAGISLPVTHQGVLSDPGALALLDSLLRS